VGASITGWGSHLPERIVTNLDLEQRLDTSDTWIVERTGIRERHMGGLCSTMAIEAGKMAIARAGLNGADIDILILATTTPTRRFRRAQRSYMRPSAFRAVRSTSMRPAPVFPTRWSLRTGYCAVAIMQHSSLALTRCRALPIWKIGPPPSSLATAPAAVVVEADDSADFVVAYDLGVDGFICPPPLCRPWRVHPDGWPRGLPTRRSC